MGECDTVVWASCVSDPLAVLGGREGSPVEELTRGELLAECQRRRLG